MGSDGPFEQFDGVVSLEGDEQIRIDDVCLNIGEERVRDVDSLPATFVDCRIQFIDVGALFEIWIDIQEYVAQLLQDRLGFEHGEVLLARHDSGIHSALDVVTGVLEGGRKAADPVPVEKQPKVLIRLASGERDEQGWRDVIGVVVCLDVEVDLSGPVSMWLGVRNALENTAFDEVFHVLVDSRRRTIEPLGEFLDRRGIEGEHPGINLRIPLVRHDIGNGEHRIEWM